MIIIIIIIIIIIRDFKDTVLAFLQTILRVFNESMVKKICVFASSNWGPLYVNSNNDISNT